MKKSINHEQKKQLIKLLFIAGIRRIRVDIEDQIGIGWNDIAETGGAVSQPGWYVQCPSAAHFHAFDAMIPARDDVRDAKGKCERLVPLTAAVELFARRSIRIFQPAGIVDFYE